MSDEVEKPSAFERVLAAGQRLDGLVAANLENPLWAARAGDYERMRAAHRDWEEATRALLADALGFPDVFRGEVNEALEGIYAELRLLRRAVESHERKAESRASFGSPLAPAPGGETQ